MNSALSDSSRLFPDAIHGIYVDHWEAARFVVVTGRRFFGLLPKREKWQALFPEGFQLPGDGQPRTIRSPARYFRMTVKGAVGPKGRFGHMGICSRQLTIDAVLACEVIGDPGHTW